MRISSFDRFATSVGSLQQRQQDLAQSQEQLTSGKRIAKPSDDPTALSRAESAYLTQKRADSHARLMAASRNAMTLAESTLGQAGDVLQSAREVVVQAGNGTYTAGERGALVAQLKSLREQLFGLANQSDGAGGFVFGGQGSSGSPFLDTPGGVVAASTAGETRLSDSDGLPTTVDGSAVWLSAATGNGVFVTASDANNTGNAWINAGTVGNPAQLTGANYEVRFSTAGGSTTYSIYKDGQATGQQNMAYRSTGAIEVDGMSFNITGEPADGDAFTLSPSQHTLDPFAALDHMISVLGDAGTPANMVSQTINLGLRDLDQVMSQLQGARSAAGATLNRIDSLELRNADRKLWATNVQSDAEDLDMVQAISNFQNQQTGYQAALQTYATVQRMSLFDYMK